MIQRLKGKKAWAILTGFCIIPWMFSVNTVWSQEKGYPSKPIEAVINAAPGGSSDISTRIITEELSRRLKVPFVVINHEGAGGMTGAVKVLKAKPDGYTLLSTGSSSMTCVPLQSPDPPFDTFKDFIPLCCYGSTPVVFVVHKSSPFKTLEELIRFAKGNPGKLTCGLPNIGREPHLDLELLKKAAAVNIKVIPYKGTGDVIAALLGKHIDMVAQTYIASIPYLKSGETRAMAITQKVANSGIPTTAETGYPHVNISVLLGFFVSAKTPKTTYEKLIPHLEGVVKDPDIAKKLETSGVLPEYKSPSDFTAELKDNWDSISKIVEEIGLKK